MGRVPRRHPPGVSGQQEITRLLAGTNGLVVRRQHPELAGAMDWALHTRRLRAVLPGVYAVPEIAHLADTRIRAVCLRHPDAVLLTAAAARVSFWPQAPLAQIRVAVRSPIAAKGFDFTRRRIPPEFVVEQQGLRFTHPALTAIDMATFQCTDAIDRALRTRAATLPGMYEALRLTGNRIGNPERMRLLLDSRDLPWSAAERLGHRILRRARIFGWRTNLPVFLGGRLYYLDIAFPLRKGAIEIDGRLHEEDKDLFESDRWRQNALVVDGWRVLRFTWDMLHEHPEVVAAAVRDAIA
jgi:very-short-patch-repair endonuclease